MKTDYTWQQFLIDCHIATEGYPPSEARYLSTDEWEAANGQDIYDAWLEARG